MGRPLCADLKVRFSISEVGDGCRHAGELPTSPIVTSLRRVLGSRTHDCVTFLRSGGSVLSLVHIYRKPLVDRVSLMVSRDVSAYFAAIGRTGGKAAGARKRRGGSSYYKALAARAIKTRAAKTQKE